MSTRVYSYGTVPQRIAPIHGIEQAEQQLRIAGRLWNLLVVINRTRMERYRKLMYDATQERIDALRVDIDGLRESIRAARKLKHSRKADLGEMPERLDALRQECGKLIEQQKNSAAERHAARRTELEALKNATSRRIVKARQAAASCGLFWGSYNDVLQRADIARKAGEMQFRRTRPGSDGTLTAQVMGGAGVAQCVSRQHTFFRIEAATFNQKWRYASMRIGSHPDRSPQWLSIPIVYHREIPEEACIKSVSMTRRGGKWQLNVTVTMEGKEPRSEGLAIAVDLGWRLMDDGSVRVGYWIDSAGKQGDVRVSARDLSGFSKVYDLRAITDKLRDDFRDSLSAWLKTQELPEEWQRETQAMGQWRSGDRLARLVRWWADHRLPGDEETFDAAKGWWRKKHLHLSGWRRNQEAKSRLRVREQYRIFAAQTIPQYATVYIEDFDLRAVAKHPPVESDQIVTASSGYRYMVSPSVFRAALLNVADREGVRVVKLDAAYTTRTCHACGYGGEWDQAASLVHRCGGCGAEWDQDANAARNLLQLGVASGGAAATKNQQVRVAKWKRLKDRSQVAG